MPNVPVLVCDRVSRDFRAGGEVVHAVRGVSFAVSAGELVAVAGPSGSGKTTLLSLAGALDRPTSGEVTVCGAATSALNAAGLARIRRDRVGFVFQDFNLVAELTAAENVSLPRELAGVGHRAARREALSALDEVGMGSLAGRYPGELSGGQQQRVAIARALLGERRLLLADEPTGALDSTTGAQIMDLVRSCVDAGAAGVLVTHDPRVAERADRTLRLVDGCLADGPVGVSA